MKALKSVIGAKTTCFVLLFAHFIGFFITFAAVKLSIIIPVYQVEKTLSRCIDSVLGQSFDDYELILIDDGSTDQSGAICDDYALRDNRICVIHQSNSGLSSARNAGISIARGQYITFIDSDDFLGDNTLPILMTRLSAHPDYDILEYPLCYHYGDSDQSMVKFGAHEYDDMKAYWLDCKAYQHTYAWNKIYARHLFDDVRFPEDRLFEDAHTLPQLLKRAHLVATTEEGVYNYCFNPDGISMNPGKNGLSDLLDAHVYQLRHLGLTEELTEYYCHVLNIQIDVYRDTHSTPVLPVPYLKSSTINHLPVDYKTKMKLRTLQLIGLKKLCQLHRILHPARKRH